MNLLVILVGILTTSQTEASQLNIEGEWKLLQRIHYFGTSTDKINLADDDDKYIFGKHEWSRSEKGKLVTSGTYLTNENGGTTKLDMHLLKSYHSDKSRDIKYKHECVYKLSGDTLTIIAAMPDEMRPDSITPSNFEAQRFRVIKLKRIQEE